MSGATLRCARATWSLLMINRLFNVALLLLQVKRSKRSAPTKIS